VGADDYIKKPFSPAELRERVEALLGREREPE
jgi:DNA-binding response OmpR family regulator